MSAQCWMTIKTQGWWIGSHGPTMWPPRSQDVTPSDFLLTCGAKFTNLLATFSATWTECSESFWKKNQEEMINIRLEMFRITMTNFLERLYRSREANGDLFEWIFLRTTIVAQSYWFMRTIHVKKCIGPTVSIKLFDLFNLLHNAKLFSFTLFPAVLPVNRVLVRETKYYWFAQSV